MGNQEVRKFPNWVPNQEPGTKPESSGLNFLGQPRSYWLYREVTVYYRNLLGFAQNFLFFTKKFFILISYHYLVNINVTRFAALGSHPLNCMLLLLLLYLSCLYSCQRLSQIQLIIQDKIFKIFIQKRQLTQMLKNNFLGFRFRKGGHRNF